MINDIRVLASSGISIQEISSRLGISYGKVYRLVRKNNIQCSDGRSNYSDERLAKRRLLSQNQEIEVIHHYLGGMSLKTIGIIYNTTSATILSILRRNNIPTRLKSGLWEKIPTKLTKEELTDLYHDKKLSTYQIAEQCGYTSHAQVVRDMKMLDISRRGYSDAGKAMYVTRPGLKEKISSGLLDFSRTWMISNPTSLELSFMDWCIANNIEYNPQYQMPNSQLLHCYDFYLPDYNLLVETDGDYWHSNEQVKQNDKIYDNVAKSNGYNIIRFLGSTIKKTKGKCFDDIIREYNR